MEANIKTAITMHVKENWPNAEFNFVKWTVGGILVSIPDFVVCKISPSQDNKSWIYISIGASKFINEKGEHLEFVLVAPYDSPEHIETLAMVANYHSDPKFRLELGSVVAIGRGWVENSKCDHLMLDLPFFKGPELEVVNINKHAVRILWLVPISKSEYGYLETYGKQALEDELERNRVRVTDPFRKTLFQTF